jgi:predicted transposase YdaD
MAKKKKSRITLGTDDVFLKLMKVSGSSLLKLFGLPAEKAEKYHFHAVVLKDKSLKPDIEGFPLLESETGRIFLEFQGYKDPFIRHRLMAEVFLGCAEEEYEGSVMAGIVYTDKKYQNAAKPLNAFNGFEKEECHLKGCFREIVLTDYTQEELEAIDPKLIVLAPFTLSGKTDKTTLLAKGREWQKAVTKRFPVEKHEEILSVLGLLILNRFCEITYEEVIAMLKFDLMDTVAGRQLYEMGEQKGLQEGLQEGLLNVRNMLLDALEARFGLVPHKMIDQIRTIDQLEMLNSLFKQAMRCPDLHSFKKQVSS